MKYYNAFIAYVDLLGFTKLVEEGNKTVDELNVILFMPAKNSFVHGRSVYEENNISFNFWFSDSYIRSINLETHELCSARNFIDYELKALCHYQIKTLRDHNLIMRGSIRIGDFFSDAEKNIFFGPAYIAAYKDEQEKAKFPRIIIDESVILFYDNPPPWYKGIKEKKINDDVLSIYESKLVSKDEDGLFFIDYLDYSLRWNISGIEDLLTKHKIHIIDNLKNNKLIEKYYWMKDYHNRTIQRYKHLLNDYKIDEQQFIIPDN